MTTTIKFDHVTKKFADKVAVDDLSLSINEGDLFVLVGTSGSGKTTTLKMINQLTVQTSGDIFFKERKIKDYDLRKMRLKMGYVLQQIALFPTMTVAQNIELIPEMIGEKKVIVAKTVDELLDSVSLDPTTYRNRLPKELSGGEQQRVGILRALAANPDVVLMDEPFSALDPISRTQLQDMVLALHQKYHNTIVFVTHDMNEALKLGNRVAVMSHGKMLQVDTPDNIAQHPASDFVREFFRSARANSVYDVYIGRVTFEGYQVNGSLPKTANVKDVDPEETLRDVFGDLETYDYVHVVDSTGKELGYVGRRELLAYLHDF